jgi:hypothetical protein
MKTKRTTEWGDWFHDGDPDATHERLGNAWWAWMFWVFILEQSADYIWERSFYTRLRSGQLRMPMALCVNAMLLGYAIECALKALWVRKGNALVKDGKFLGVKRTRNHDLVQLAAAVGFQLDSSEQRVLLHFSKAAMFAGRYPIAKSAGAMMPFVDDTLGKSDVGYFSSNEFRTATSVINKILRQVSGKKRRVSARRRMPARFVNESGRFVR